MKHNQWNFACISELTFFEKYLKAWNLVNVLFFIKGHIYRKKKHETNPLAPTSPVRSTYGKCTPTFTNRREKRGERKLCMSSPFLSQLSRCHIYLDQIMLKVCKQPAYIDKTTILIRKTISRVSLILKYFVRSFCYFCCSLRSYTRDARKN